MLDAQAVRQALTGPVPSVFTPFRRDGAIDYDALRNYIDFAIAGGSRSIILTYGDSHYGVLDDEEVAQLTRAVVTHTAGRAMVVAAARSWGTARAVEFARYVREIGGDMLMVRPFPWPGSYTEETMAELYLAVADCIPLMIVTGVFGQYSTKFALDVMKRVMQATKSVVAVKDDLCGEFARKLCLLVNDRWPVISGGQKQNHLNALPYGCDGYLSVFSSLKPRVAHDYWKAVQTENLAEAKNIIARYDMPFFDFTSGLVGGYDAGIHGALELFGVAKRWRRKPHYSLNDDEMERLAEFFKEKSLL